jgi:diacylglycerol kinase (ATP)
MPSFDVVAIIYNPNSTGAAEKKAKKLCKVLARSLPDMPIEMLPTEHAGHAVKLAYDTAKKHDSPLIISASGDGGYNEVINGALQAQEEGAHPICAVLPSGNANDHARTMQAEPLANLIVKNVINNLDVLKVVTTGKDKQTVTRYAHSYVGIGLTPTVAVELNKQDLNSLKEAWIVTKTFWNLRPVVLRVGHKTIEVDSLICSNIPQMAKALTISSAAQADDGMFELTTLPHNNKPKLILRLAMAVFRDFGAHRRVQSFKCTVIDPAPIQLDGEVMELKARTALEVSLRPGILRTVVKVS